MRLLYFATNRIGVNRKTMKPAQRLVLGYYQAKINMLHAISPSLGGRAALKLFTTPVTGRRKKLPAIMKHAHPLRMLINGNKIEGYQWQPRQQIQAKLLILHGYGSRIASFEPIIAMSRRLGYEVYGFDAPAHGDSSGKQLNAIEYAKLVQAVTDAYGPFDAMVAHSMGGLALMLAMEKRAFLPKPKVALICPATESSTAARMFLDFMDFPEGLRQSFYKEVENRSGLSINWYSISRVIDNIAADILWIHEKTDEVTPLSDVQPIMDRQLPHVEFYLTEGFRHNGIYRQNEVKQVLENFLSLPGVHLPD